MATKIEQPRIERAARLLAIADKLRADQDAATRARGDVPADPNYGLTDNEVAAAQMMNGLLAENERLEAENIILRQCLYDEKHGITAALKKVTP